MNRLISTIHRHAVLLKRAGALLIVALVMLLGILEVCPAAHEWFHRDAGQVEHTCAVTLFAHGVEPMVAAGVLAIVVWRLLFRAVTACEVFVQAPAFCHLPGRAPPTR